MRRLCVTALSLAILLSACAGFAQQAATITVPNLIRYGGTLKDTQGAPLVSTTVGVTFAIYSQQDGGAPIWMETQNVITDAAGNYSALLGSTTASGLPADLFSQQEQRWLGVQVQGQSEQPRVLMVSVPYAFKAHEAETLGGKSVSDFVLANGATPAATCSSGGVGVSLTANAGSTQSAASDVHKGQTMTGPTDFIGSTTDQIVSVEQDLTGAGIIASAPTLAIQGTATAPTGTAYGVQGLATGTAGVGLIGTASSPTGFTYGLRGTSSSSSGTGVRGIDVATSGSTTGISGYVNSASGTAGVLNNAAGGRILLGQNNGATKFTVDGSGNVTISGNFTGSGTGITGLTFTQLTGQLGSSQFSGSYSNAVTLSNTGNAFTGNFTGSGAGITGITFTQLTGQLGSSQLSGTYSNAVTLSNTGNAFTGSFTGSFTGNGSGLTGVLPAPGSPNYIQNGTSQQSSANFNISGNGTLGGNLAANVVSSSTTYQLGSSNVLGVGSFADENLFVGVNAGANNVAGQGTHNAFSGHRAGYSNTTGAGNSFFGHDAGYNNTTGSNDVYIGHMGPSSGTESNTIRIGTGGSDGQTAAYIAGIIGGSTSSGSPVFIDSTGKLGTGGGTGLVTSFNGRAGAVVPASGDYSFSLLSGTLADAQLSGTYSHAVTLSNSGNSFTGSGAGLTGVNPAPGSSNYIQNTTSPQSANFDITGSGALGGSLTANAGVAATFSGAGNAVSGSALDFNGTANGVFGQTTSGSGAGVYGNNTSPSGNAYGVAGFTSSTSPTAVGVFGQATSGPGVAGNSTGAAGVLGQSSTGPGVSGTGFYGAIGNANATSGGATGVYGQSGDSTGYGVYGINTATSGTAAGVYGQSGNGDGVYGTSASATGAGVYAINTNTSGGGYEGAALIAQADGPGAAGVFINNNNSSGILLLGGNANGTPFEVDASGSVEMYGPLTVSGEGGSGTSLIEGNLTVTGTLTKGGGSFKIDDPLDPANKTLSHSFVESPDMMNIYNGNVTTDKRGLAVVVLPNYFEALNRDFRYQLTVIGQFAQAIVAKEISGGRFTIKTNKPEVKVSWQVTGIRQDAWANAHRIPNEEDKPLDKRGTYLHPELYGASADHKTDAMLRP